MDDKTAIYAYLQSNKYMTLATADKNGKPEAATVEFLVDGDDLLMSTFVHYRKYKNLIENPFVACVVTTAHEKTLQLDGIAQQLEGAEAKEAGQKLLAADPGFAAYFNEEATRFFRIMPIWMRLRDYATQPLHILEYEVSADRSKAVSDQGKGGKR